MPKYCTLRFTLLIDNSPARSSATGTEMFNTHGENSYEQHHIALQLCVVTCMVALV